MNQRAADGNRTFKGIHRFSISDFVTERGQQTIFRLNGIRAGVQQHEAARAVGVLGFADVETSLTKERGLLITQITGNGDAANHTCRLTVHFRRRSNLRQHCARHAHHFKNRFVPIERLEIHQHRAAGVGHVSDVNTAG